MISECLCFLAAYTWYVYPSSDFGSRIGPHVALPQKRHPSALARALSSDTAQPMNATEQNVWTEVGSLQARVAELELQLQTTSSSQLAAHCVVKADDGGWQFRTLSSNGVSLPQGTSFLPSRLLRCPILVIAFWSVHYCLLWFLWHGKKHIAFLQTLQDLSLCHPPSRKKLTSEKEKPTEAIAKISWRVLRGKRHELLIYWWIQY